MTTTPPPDERAVAHAFLIAPIVPVVLAIVAFVFADFQLDYWPMVLMFLWVGLPISYAITLFLGLPAVMVLRHRGWLTPVTATLVGPALGAVAAVPFAPPIRPWELYGAAAVAGLACSLTFTIIAWSGARAGAPATEQSRDPNATMESQEGHSTDRAQARDVAGAQQQKQKQKQKQESSV